MKAKLLALIASAAVVALPGIPASAETVLNVITAGDQNMVDYINDYLGPKFEKDHPGVTVRAVGTGPGDAGSLKIFEKLDAEAKAGRTNWDIDVAVVHQRGAAQMLGDQLLAKYRGDIDTGKLVTSQMAENALGTDVTGYVMPMFNSQIAIAYNPEEVKDPPKTFDELEKWVAAHPKQFGYNGIKGGMSGVGFVMGWVAAKTGDADKLDKGPYDPAEKAKIDEALTAMKAFNANVTMTPGNAGTLDMLNRGEIAMGPVWVDMFYT
jgi:putative spermidine/putrescine transport system substrate-binding protein